MCVRYVAHPRRLIRNPVQVESDTLLFGDGGLGVLRPHVRPLSDLRTVYFVRLYQNSFIVHIAKTHNLATLPTPITSTATALPSEEIKPVKTLS